jgi:hypothetical protein
MRALGAQVHLAVVGQRSVPSLLACCYSRPQREAPASLTGLPRGAAADAGALERQQSPAGARTLHHFSSTEPRQSQALQARAAPPAASHPPAALARARVGGTSAV